MLKKITLLTATLFVMPMCVRGAEKIDLKNTKTHNETYNMSMQKGSEATIQLSIQKIEDKDQKKQVQIKLSNIKNGGPITLNDLKEAHTQKIHLLIIDSSLADYSHIHPRETKIPGVYEFEWDPKKQGSYRIWADLLPATTNIQEYAIADLTKGKNSQLKIRKKLSLTNTIDDLTFALSFDDKTLQAGKATIGTIHITDSKGQPFAVLEPIMGAFAHIVGFADDFKSIVHIHPMGKEPNQSTDRGKSPLQFHLEPEKPGFVKFFVQVKIKGQEEFIPFGILVQ